MDIIEALYDHRFDNMLVEDIDFNLCTKNKLTNVLAAGIPREEYATIEEMEEEFQVSRYQINKLLRDIDAKPFGELINIDEHGNRSRGVGKVVYKRETIQAIKDRTADRVDVDAIKAQAASILNMSD